MATELKRRRPERAAIMGSPAHPARRRREPLPDRWHHLGNDALRFGRWATRSKFRLMESFLGELNDAPYERDPAEIERRFLSATRHARRVETARAVVTFFLALGALVTAGSALLERLGTVRVIAALQGAAAIAGSLTLILLIARLAFDRYLALVETSATFLAMQLATSRRLTSGAPSSEIAPSPR